MTKMRSSVNSSNHIIKKIIRKTELSTQTPARTGIQKGSRLHPDAYCKMETTRWTRYTSEKTSMSWFGKVL